MTHMSSLLLLLLPLKSNLVGSASFAQRMRTQVEGVILAWIMCVITRSTKARALFGWSRATLIATLEMQRAKQS